MSQFSKNDLLRAIPIDFGALTAVGLPKESQVLVVKAYVEAAIRSLHPDKLEGLLSKAYQEQGKLDALDTDSDPRFRGSVNRFGRAHDNLSQTYLTLGHIKLESEKDPNFLLQIIEDGLKPIVPVIEGLTKRIKDLEKRNAGVMDLLKELQTSFITRNPNDLINGPNREKFGFLVSPVSKLAGAVGRPAKSKQLALTTTEESAESLKAGESMSGLVRISKQGMIVRTALDQDNNSRKIETNRRVVGFMPAEVLINLGMFKNESGEFLSTQQFAGLTLKELYEGSKIPNTLDDVRAIRQDQFVSLFDSDSNPLLTLDVNNAPNAILVSMSSKRINSSWQPKASKPSLVVAASQENFFYFEGVVEKFKLAGQTKTSKK